MEFFLLSWSYVDKVKKLSVVTRYVLWHSVVGSVFVLGRGNNSVASVFVLRSSVCVCVCMYAYILIFTSFFAVNFM